MGRTSVFLGYPSSPRMLGEALRNAAISIARLADTKTWEDLRIGGKPIITEIFSAIDAADVGLFDVSHLNENVLFELGYAIARGKVVWPLRDQSDSSTSSQWKRFSLLDTTGQIFYENSENLFIRFTTDRPDIQGTPFFAEQLEPHLAPGRSPSLLYLSSPAETEASRALTRTINEESARGISSIEADPLETNADSLVWFTQHVYAARAVVVHFLPPTRTGYKAHNARCALIAGLSIGMDRPTLMLAEAPYETPIDYRDYLYVYETAVECRERTTYWLTRNLASTHQEILDRNREARALELSTELQAVNLGEYVAENESAALREYFIETPVFREVVSGPSRILVGRKGSGKSATLIQAERAIREDKRAVVTVIKPAGYELAGLVRLLNQFEEISARGYLIESLWKYLLYSEIAMSLERDYKSRPAGVLPNTPEWELFQFLGDNRSWMGEDFGQRLEAAVTRLLSSPSTGTSLGEERRRLSEQLHAGPIRKLRSLLAPVLAERSRVALLIDNLDKAWEKSTDINVLSRVILGLLGSMDAFRADLESARPGSSITVTLSIFIRSDIFTTINRLAREPDKLPVRRLRWDDSNDLIRLVEERFMASRPESITGELWNKFFCPRVRGIPTAEYLALAVLPKPRDMLYLTRAAIDRAITNRHPRVEEGDVLAAESSYSQFAFDATIVETDITYRNLDSVLIEFAGMPSELTRSELRSALDAAGVPEEEHQGVIEQLRTVSFLGVRTGEDEYSFTDDIRESQRANVLARRYASRRSTELEYGIHRAFWSYLELETPSSQLRFESS